MRSLPMMLSLLAALLPITGIHYQVFIYSFIPNKSISII